MADLSELKPKISTAFMYRGSMPQFELDKLCHTEDFKSGDVIVTSDTQNVYVYSDHEFVQIYSDDEFVQIYSDDEFDHDNDYYNAASEYAAQCTFDCYRRI